MKRKTSEKRIKRKQQQSSPVSSDTSDIFSCRSCTVEIEPETRNCTPTKSTITLPSVQPRSPSVKSIQSERKFNHKVFAPSRGPNSKTQVNRKPCSHASQGTASTQTETIKPFVLKKTNSTQTVCKNIEPHTSQMVSMETRENCREPTRFYSSRQQKPPNLHEERYPIIKVSHSQDKCIKTSCPLCRSNEHNLSLSYAEEDQHLSAQDARKTIFGVRLKPVQSPERKQYWG